jgi:hypothetical protein
MLLVCVVLVCAQWMLYPTGRTAQDNALRSLGLGIGLVLCALRILTSSRPRRVAGLVAMLIGLMLGLFGPLAAHQEVGVAWVEAALGAVVVLAGGAVLFSRNPS